MNSVAIAQICPGHASHTISQQSSLMKQVVVALIPALIAVYGVGRFNPGEAGAMRFMTKMESLTNVA